MAQHGVFQVMSVANRRFVALFTTLAVLLCLLVGCFALGAGQAYATYADYDTKNPSEQGLGDIGDPIYVQDIPDGVYEVHARTSSNMCILYRTEDDANRHAGKEMCYIDVENGVMTAVFYISNMYNRLYLGGTGEQAAALTNPDGTDDSAYLRGEPADGYVPHLFTMQIPALNYPMYFASFAGGNYSYDPDPNSGWNTRAMWYSRTVVFKPTDELLQVIEAAKNGGTDNSDPVDENPDDGDSGTDVPGGDVPGTDVPGTDEPGGDVPGGDEPGGDVPGTDVPGTDVPGTDVPGTDEPGGDVPGGDEPGGDVPGTDVPGGDEPGTDVPGTNKPGTDVPGTNKPGTDVPGTDVPGGDEPGDDVPGTDVPGGDVPGTDVPGTDVPGGDEPGGDDSENGSRDDDGNNKNNGTKDNGGKDDPANDNNKPSNDQDDDSGSSTPATSDSAPEPEPEDPAAPEPEPVPAPDAVSEESVQSGGAVVRHGILITPAVLELEKKEAQQQTDMPEMVEVKPKGLSPMQIAALIVGGLVCAGIILRFVLFSVSKR